MSHPVDPDQPAPTEPRADAPPDADPALVAVVREIEEYAAGEGWDRPARLFALVPTPDLLAREPALAEAMGIAADGSDDVAGTLTPVEQELPTDGAPVEDLLAQIGWPEEVTGCAVVVERLVLPSSVDGQLPEDPEAAQQYAEQHPERQDIRVVAAAMRSGETWCALRMREQDDPRQVVESADLVPGLLELLTGTLDQ